MGLLRAVSIRTKLIVLVTASGCIALLLCCAGFVFNDVRTLCSARVQELTLRADLLAFKSSALLSQEDAPAATRLLASLHAQPSVESACLYDAGGRPLATYVADGRAAPDFPPPKGNGYRFLDRQRVELSQRVVDQGETVGTLCIRANACDVREHLWSYAAISATVMIFSLIVSIVLSAGLQRSISRPIEALARASERITTEGDYSIRVDQTSSDELGDLCRAFNAMLGRIEASEKALQKANDRLEDRVRQRTDELEEEIKQREVIQTDLKRSRDAAEAANRAKSQFLANMSHEIRTPMNAVLGFTDLLRKGVDGGNEAERQDYLETIHTSARHLLGLIDNILDLSKIEAGKFDVVKSRCSVHQVIAEVVSVLRVRAQQRGLELEYQWSGDIPETIETDPARLRELLMNLVGNAIKFTRVGRVQIFGRLAYQESRPLVEIRVVDTGVGIAAENLRRIFDPFVQADTSVTREFGGTGLGLAICRRITEALGGSLSVASEYGRGSVFTATIDTGPLEGVAVLSAPPADAVQSRQETQRIDAQRLTGSRILLVEDGDTNRKLVTIVLQRAGAEVTCAINGQMGVELASERVFDLILMDMQMPVMDGYTATTRLRQQGVTTPVYALTANAMKGDQQRCDAVGCSGYLTKPIEPDELLHAVAGALGKQRSGIPEDGAKPSSVSTDGTALVSSLPMDDADFREVVEEFADRFHEKIEAMRRARAANNMEELARLGHWLKGAGGTAGFAALTEPAKRLEVAAKSRASDRIEVLIDELSDMAARIVVPS